MNISATTNTTTALGASPLPQAGPQGDDSNYSVFLKMLTAQIKNQDPLKPMGAEDFAAQLATFSSVEQQTMTNDLLRSMMDLQSGNSVGDFASWIGKGVPTREPVQFDGAPLHITWNDGAAQESTQLAVIDASNADVAYLPLTNNQTFTTWDGLNSDGSTGDIGPYRFELRTPTEAGGVSAQEAFGYASVQEVRRGPDGLWMMLSNGSLIPADEADGLRAL